MSDDTTTTEISQDEKAALLAVENTVVEESPMKQHKSQEDSTSAQVKPLSQQPAPTPEEPPHKSIFRRVAAHDREINKSGVPFSALPKEQRDRIMKDIEEMDQHREAVKQHFAALKGESDFEGEDADEWTDVANVRGMGGSQKMMAYVGAGAQLHKRNINQINMLQKELAEERARNSTKPPQQQQQPQQERITTNGGAVKSFADKPVQQDSVKPQTTPTQNNSQSNKTTYTVPKLFGELSNQETGFYSENRASVISANDLLSQFKDVEGLFNPMGVQSS